jgi:flagellar hook-basal body complex protein FliE
MKLTEVASSLSGVNKNSLLNSSVSNVGMTNNQQSMTNGESFAQILKQSVNEVNNSQVQAYNAMEDIATGKVKNLQEAVQKIEEAELSLKLGLEVKNKALGAYKQVMAMQI